MSALPSHHLLPLLGVALIVGFLAPAHLARARWAHQAPRFAAGMWGALALLFLGTTSLAVAQLILPEATSHRLAELGEAALPWTTGALDMPTPGTLRELSPRDTGALLAASVPPLVAAAALVRELGRARKSRSRHAELLRLVGSRDSRLRATVLTHETPVVYCLPGRSSQVVVSSGALHTLTEAQLTAALEHERAHVSGRHHLPVAATAAFAAVFRGLPLAARALREVPLLLEMAADDRALSRSSRDALATALYAMAAGQVPRAAFAAGGPTAAVRVRRILTPHSDGHPVLRALFAVTAATGALTPLVMACCSIPG